MKQDRFLIGILVFIALLVIAALVLFFVRQDASPTYRPDDTPEGVVYNFALAIQQQDVERAYGYLADIDNKPSETYFRQTIMNGYIDNSVSLELGQAQIDGDQAWVTVISHYVSSSPFDSGWTSTENATLLLQDGQWRITYMPYPFWVYDWYMPPPEPVKP